MFNPTRLNKIGYRALPKISSLKGKIRGANIHKKVKFLDARRRTPRKMLVTMKARQSRRNLLG